MDVRKLKDEELLRLLQKAAPDEAVSGLERQIFREIYERYWLRLLQAAWQKTGNREISEELVQELFISLWERRREIQINKSLHNYLHTALRYRIINHIRAEMLSSDHLKVFMGQGLSAENGTEKHIYMRELNNRLQASIRQLPGKSRTIFELSRSRHFSNKQIAGQLKISEKTVEYHLSKSLKLLRNLLKDYVTFFF